MSTIVHEQLLNHKTLPREVLIGRIRAMLAAAESPDGGVITLDIGYLQLDVDYECGEITVYTNVK